MSVQSILGGTRTRGQPLWCKLGTYKATKVLTAPCTASVRSSKGFVQREQPKKHKYCLCFFGRAVINKSIFINKHRASKMQTNNLTFLHKYVIIFIDTIAYGEYMRGV